MQLTIIDIIQYIKNPNCETLQISFIQKTKTLFRLLLISLVISFTLGTLISILAFLGLFEIDSHAISKLFDEKSKATVFLMAVVVAPVFEELLFRAPISLFCSNKYFKYIFYAFAIVFGMIHISNYEISLPIILLSPILVAPQIILGLILGYTRIKLGIVYSILLHLLFNGILIVPSLLFLEI